ncbi:hypothetical protein BDV29DRAFT_179265 [Aspergillus leporis]|uniref:Uncharacterized protein n=1 Tax=Aspergillus leporis TaxID=41062 RepID=A0A5N5WS58_9EURO|nr:hypothetical protein BDV29DRAFT_179265 [Aspergillus leporis]
MQNYSTTYSYHLRGHRIEGVLIGAKLLKSGQPSGGYVSLKTWAEVHRVAKILCWTITTYILGLIPFDLGITSEDFLL